MKKIFVGCMPFRTSSSQISRWFEPYGKVKSIRLFQDLKNAKFDSYAHVVLDGDVQKAINDLDGLKMGEKYLKINLAPVSRRK